MSEFEINKAKDQTRQSNHKLESALNNLKDTVDTKAGAIGERRENLNNMLEDKQQEAKDFVEHSFEVAENFINRQSENLHQALQNTRGETEQFLKDVQSSLDTFAQDVQHSVSKALGGIEDRRITSFVTLFFAGTLFGAFLSRRMNRSRSGVNALPGAVENKADINPNTSNNMRKIA